MRPGVPPVYCQGPPAAVRGWRPGRPTAAPAGGRHQSTEGRGRGQGEDMEGRSGNRVQGTVIPVGQALQTGIPIPQKTAPALLSLFCSLSPHPCLPPHLMLHHGPEPLHLCRTLAVDPHQLIGMPLCLPVEGNRSTGKRQEDEGGRRNRREEGRGGLSNQQGLPSFPLPLPLPSPAGCDQRPSLAAWALCLSPSPCCPHLQAATSAPSLAAWALCLRRVRASACPCNEPCKPCTCRRTSATRDNTYGEGARGGNV